MFSFRGDAHKLYRQLRKANYNLAENKYLVEIAEIEAFYSGIESSILQKIYYRMTKEKNGSGIIPILITSGPWLLLLFSNQIQSFLFKEGSFLWVFFVVIYISILTISVVLHFHEKSWAAVHMEIIQDILEQRGGES
ncbi:hypothetical protein ABET41_04325 [Metabacillus fastidiosus]|uniref:Uncharacterized protein n=1 Tax=Metabacillus fastidiosus TaxID=1458 RepID=A0ABU6P2S0_9BACI|nr:hypothetical protein [Metabacillus fastidiosus]MEC2075236.1 hypothetical protein [Metabacillus fastidiosus]MED4403657.1 hypothetical protein [Metabacillus fastidiosus]MED4452448.1 hypothetical protein [Metabacillus fastidiosus]MED4463616.1 hypothetical protein [Metabacillus fastidiosus]